MGIVERTHGSFSIGLNRLTKQSLLILGYIKCCEIQWWNCGLFCHLISLLVLPSLWGLVHLLDIWLFFLSKRKTLTEQQLAWGCLILGFWSSLGLFCAYVQLGRRAGKETGSLFLAFAVRSWAVVLGFNSYEETPIIATLFCLFVC